MINDIDLVELLRLIGNEFQDITAPKDILWDLYISSRGRGNLNRLLPLGHNVNSDLIRRERGREREGVRWRKRDTEMFITLLNTG